MPQFSLRVSLLASVVLVSPLVAEVDITELAPILVEASDGVATEGTGSYSTERATVGGRQPVDIRDIPQSITVVTEERLEDANANTTVILGDVAAKPSNRDIDDVIGDEANVLASEGFIPPAIRGVGGLGGDRPAITVGAQPRVPVLVDDVPLASGEASNITQTSGWDIDSIEVARGPQAASTGRNTLGGAIRVYTKDPVFEREGALRFLYTDQQEAETAFMLNTPLVEDQLAFRLVGEFGSGDSYIQNGPNPLPAGFDPNDESSERLRAKPRTVGVSATWRF